MDIYIPFRFVLSSFKYYVFCEDKTLFKNMVWYYIEKVKQNNFLIIFNIPSIEANISNDEYVKITLKHAYKIQ